MRTGLLDYLHGKEHKGVPYYGEHGHLASYPYPYDKGQWKAFIDQDQGIESRTGRGFYHHGVQVDVMWVQGKAKMMEGFPVKGEYFTSDSTWLIKWDQRIIANLTQLFCCRADNMMIDPAVYQHLNEIRNSRIFYMQENTKDPKRIKN